MASSSWPSRRAASRGVRPSHTEIQLRGAPRPSKYWAAVRWPPWQAHQKATVNSGTGVKEHIEDVDVVAARGPMQRRLGVGPGDAGVDIGTCRRQHRRGGGSVVEVAGPIGRDVQEGARAVLPAVAIHGTDPGAGQPGVVA